MDVLRLVQGTGGAAAFAAAMSSLAPLFHGAARARAFSLLGTTFGIGLSFGPLASGWLVEAAGWQWVFLATGLVGLLGAAMVAAGVRATPAGMRGRLDWRGALCFTGALGLFTCGMLLAPETGWRSPGVLGSLLASAVLAVAFVRVERRIASPLLELGLFRNARFVGVQALAASPAFLFIALIAMLPGRFIGMDGYGALAAGQLMIGLAAPLLVVPFGRAADALVQPRPAVGGGPAGRGRRPAHAGRRPGARRRPAPAHGPDRRRHRPALGPDGCAGGQRGGQDKVGMATGIFNTVRVSADGVAIAVLSALLAFLIQARLGAALPADPRWPWPRTAPRWVSWPRRPPCCRARPTCCARATARPSASCCGCWRPSRR